MTFFPYHPLKLRLAVGACLVAALALAAWGLADAVHGGSTVAFARAGLALGLVGALTWLFMRTRPREGWGVNVGPTALSVSRAREGAIEVPWSAVREARWNGKPRDTYILFLTNDTRVLVPRHLFASGRQFDALVAAIEERLPPPRHDA